MSTVSANHLFPFKVNKEGKVDTAQYLSVVPSKTYTQTEGRLPHYTTMVMGRLLEGIQITPPSHCEGYVWEQGSKDEETHDDGYDDDYLEDEEEENRKETVWKRTSAKVDNFILWKKDIAPSEHDSRLHAIESWIPITDMIHQPIPVDK